MAWEQRDFITTKPMWEIMKKTGLMVWENITGLMEITTKDNSATA